MLRFPNSTCPCTSDVPSRNVRRNNLLVNCKRGQFLILASRFPSTFRRQLVLGHGAVVGQEWEICGGKGPIAVELGRVGQIDRHIGGAGRGRSHHRYLATVGVGRQFIDTVVRW